MGALLPTMRMRCGEGGWTTSVGGLEASPPRGARAVGEEEGVPMLPKPEETVAVVRAGEGRSNPSVERGELSGVLNAS